MSRHGNRWNVSEVLSLQREYELLEMTVDQIADKHKRSVMSIVHKLYAEGFTSSLFEARGCTQKPLKVAVTSPKKSVIRVIEDEDDEDEDSVVSDTDTSSDFEDDYMSDSDDEEEYDDDFVYDKTSSKMVEEMTDDDVSEVDKLTERVWSLETSVGEIGTMVKSLFDKLVTTKSKKLQPLRKRAL
jgi:hypothetical protein